MSALPMTVRQLARTLFALSAALLAACSTVPAHAAVQATQDTTAPALPTNLHAVPYTATTDSEFVVSMILAQDESDIDRIHFTMDAPPNSPTDGETQGTAAGGGNEEFVVLSNIKGTHTVYFWLEDGEGNADFTKTATVRLFNEGTTDQILRVGARDRFATSAAVSKKDYPDDGSASSVVLVNGERPIDALGAVPLAVQAGAPVLFTRAYAIPQATWDEVRRVVNPGSVIYLIGGTVAIDANQEAFLKAQGYIVQRIGGPTRAATAVAMAALTEQIRGLLSDTFFVVNGRSLPDGLSVAPAVTRYQGGVILTDVDRMPDESLEYLKAAARQTQLRVVYVVGGREAVGDAVIDQLAAVNIFAFRIAGPDRFATSATIAATFFGDTTHPVVGLANGETVVDALTGGVHAAAQQAPVVLVKQTVAQTRCLPTARFLEHNAAALQGGYVYGGTTAIANETIRYAQDLIGGQTTTGC